MPWEKSFDEETALADVMKVFWQKGFEPASIADLLAGTGLNKGSLYNAFGGKQQLFIKALTKYDREHRQTLLAKLEALDDPNQAITTFIDATVAETAADQDHKGCFLINTALEVTRHNEEVSALVNNGVRGIEGFFRRCIEVGQARNEMPDSIEPRATAKALMAMLVAIRVLGRGVYTESALQTIADEAKRLIEKPAL